MTRGSCQLKFLSSHVYIVFPCSNAALKYRLACGSLVFKLPSKWVEFYEPGLRAGKHFIELPLFTEGKPSPEEVEAYVMQQAGPTMKQAIEAVAGSTKLPKVAQAGQKWVQNNLSEEVSGKQDVYDLCDDEC